MSCKDENELLRDISEVDSLPHELLFLEGEKSRVMELVRISSMLALCPKDALREPPGVRGVRGDRGERGLFDPPFSVPSFIVQGEGGHCGMSPIVGNFTSYFFCLLNIKCERSYRDDGIGEQSCVHMKGSDTPRLKGNSL